MPISIIYQRKQGFTTPINTWFAEMLGEQVKALLFGKWKKDRRFFEHTYVEEVVFRFLSNGNYLWRVWFLVMFENWRLSFLDGERSRLM